jgi:hypothetical protein
LYAFFLYPAARVSTQNPGPLLPPAGPQATPGESAPAQNSGSPVLDGQGEGKADGKNGKEQPADRKPTKGKNP